ncbi:MAG: DUF3386 domain-containing protein [Cyanobacteriota bacterium]
MTTTAPRPAVPASFVSEAVVPAGTDLRAAFRAAYENRYTWDPSFGGYQGRCQWLQLGPTGEAERSLEGSFAVGADLKAMLEGIEDTEVHKAVASQLWEVAIHRVRRPFEQTHGDNTFTAGDSSSQGLEVIVGGKNNGDRYRIANNVVTMVHRHIHGTVVTIETESVTDTGHGYLSHRYSSRYSDPATGEPRGHRQQFTDTFVPLTPEGPWVLGERVIETEGEAGPERQSFRFLDLSPL